MLKRVINQNKDHRSSSANSNNDQNNNHRSSSVNSNNDLIMVSYLVISAREKKKNNNDNVMQSPSIELENRNSNEKNDTGEILFRNTDQNETH